MCEHADVGAYCYGMKGSSVGPFKHIALAVNGIPKGLPVFVLRWRVSSNSGVGPDDSIREPLNCEPAL